MSTQMKLIVPLLDNKLTNNLFTPKAGFIDAYCLDINKPNLDNHIFLVYDADLGDVDNYYRHKRILEMNNLHSYRYARIKGHLFLIYAFCVITQATKQLIKGRNILTDCEKYDILQFWDDDHAVCMALATNMSFDPCNAVVPEQDYQG